MASPDQNHDTPANTVETLDQAEGATSNAGPSTSNDDTEAAEYQQAILESMQSEPSHLSFEEELRKALDASLSDTHARDSHQWQDMEAFSSHANDGDHLQPGPSEQQSCKICTHPVKHPQTTPFGHTFCGECLTYWLEWSDSCPTCYAMCKL